MTCLLEPPWAKKAKSNTSKPVRQTTARTTQGKRKPLNFSDLPLELRLTIYEIALKTQTESRFIPFDPILKCIKCQKHFTALHKMPTPLLHLNSEARDLALKTTYKPFRYSASPKTVYFAPERDVVLLKDATLFLEPQFQHILKLLKDVQNLDIWEAEDVYLGFTNYTALGRNIAKSLPFLRKFTKEHPWVPVHTQQQYIQMIREGMSEAGENDHTSLVNIRIPARSNFKERLYCPYRSAGVRACVETLQQSNARYIAEYGIIKGMDQSEDNLSQVSDFDGWRVLSDRNSTQRVSVFDGLA